MPEAYVVRFKVLRISCAALTKGQQYTLTYRRGETCRSTPCYTADNNYVDFSAMPEGSAVVHFKSGGVRFQPKWINIRVEEYLRGRARKAVGETRVDCAGVLGLGNKTAATTTSVNFSLHGNPAEMTVAMLVYPEKHAPLSFSGIISHPSGACRENSSVSQEVARTSGPVKRMSTDDVVTLLLALEGAAERRRTNGTYDADNVAPLKARIAQLEERRRTFSGVEGMAKAVVHNRTLDLISAQYEALSRTHCANFTGNVAAYLRQLAASNGVPVTLDISRYTGGEATAGDSLSPAMDAAQERLERMRNRIDALTQQISKLEGEKTCMDIERSLVRDQSSAEQLEVITAKIDSLKSQRQLLQRSCTTIESAGVRSSSSYDNSPVIHEVIGIRARILALSREEDQLREKVSRMTAVAVGHVLKWARSKDPPIEEPLPAVPLPTPIVVAPVAQPKADDQAEQPPLQDPSSYSRRHEGGEPESAVPESSSCESSEENFDSDSDDGTANVPKCFPSWSNIRKSEMYGATGLPSANDFEGGVGEESKNRCKGTYADPLAGDLGSHMFLSKRRERILSGQPDPAPNVISCAVDSDLPQLDFDAPLEDTAASSQGGFFSASTTDAGLSGAGTIPTIQIISVDDDAYTYDVGETNDDPNFVAEDSMTYHAYEVGMTVEPEPAFSFVPSDVPAYSFETGGGVTFSGRDTGEGMPMYSFVSDHHGDSKNKRENENPALVFNFGS